MKKKIFCMITVLALILTLALSGCSNGKSLKDFNEYKNLDLQSVTCLEVGLDMSNGYIEFTIDSDRVVKKVTDMYSENGLFRSFGSANYGGNAGQIVMHTDKGEQFTVPLSAIKYNDYYYSYKNREIYNYLSHYALENDYDRIYYNIRQVAHGKVNLNNIQSIEVGWQTTEEYAEGSITYFDITEKEAIDYIIGKLSDKKALITVSNPPEKKNFSHIKFNDGTYFDACIINISEYGDPRCTSDEVRNFVYEYGVANGYLQN